MVSKGHEETSEDVYRSGELSRDSSNLSNASRRNTPRRQAHSSTPQRSINTPPHLESSLSSRNVSNQLRGLSRLRLDEAEVRRVSEEKRKKVYTNVESQWKESIRLQMEEDLAQRVRDALETPPLEKMARRRQELLQRHTDEHPEIERLNAQFVHELDQEHGHRKKKHWKSWRANKLMRRMMALQASQSRSNFDVIFKDELSRSNHATFPGVFGLDTMSEGMKDYTPSLLDRSLRRQASTKAGFLEAIRNGRFLDGSVLHCRPDGTFVDKHGIVRTEDGPFWPLDSGPLFPTPRFKWDTIMPNEPYSNATRVANQRTFDNQQTQYTGKWRGVLIVYDSERSPRDHAPLSVPEDCCPSLRFESRFECGNLRQARRVGQFEYELILKTDLYTNRHTQWYYFRVHNTVAGVVYKFRIANFLKKDSLYNHGMRPLMYSEKDALTKNMGWLRTGHHISYSRNVTCLHCPLLIRGVNYYMLEWQMEFPNAEDTCYLAHCYPYSFTDLREDVDSITKDTVKSKCVKKELLCESRAGNSCFLLTVSDFGVKDDEKKGVVISGRVHPGESNASWMMKGVLDFITSQDPVAKELRKKFIFKIVPMLNPDGVIVGNYRCSLAARDLNRNYRHPRKDSFPTVWYIKDMIDKMAQEREIILYCDLHGHSRKHNVFMYGNNTGEEEQGISAAKSFLNERVFPWLMSSKSPEMFTFEGCKFSIRKCKESTGRVVMWRQMRVTNSFTLEATFSGATINKSGIRHFNITDFRQMGESLVRVVGDYNRLQEDPRLHAMVIQQLTRFITRQILQSRGFAMGKFQALRQGLNKEAQPVNRLMGTMETSDTMEMDKDGKVADSLSEILVAAYYGGENEEEFPQAKEVEDLTTLLRTPSVVKRCHGNQITQQSFPMETLRTPAVTNAVIPAPVPAPVKKIIKNGTPVNRLRNQGLVAKTTGSGTKVTESFLKMFTSDAQTEPPGEQEKITSLKMQENTDLWKSNETLNLSTDIDDVIELCDAITPETMDDCLDFLDQLDVRTALQESDSSDSDSESEPEMKNTESKKKKKRKSKRQRDKERQKTEAATKKLSDDFRPKTTVLPPIPGTDNKKGPSPQLLKLDKLKSKEPLYISKYEGRHNNGIPCFAEERSAERAAKRMAEVKKRRDDPDRETNNLLSDMSPYQNFVAMVRAGDLQKAATQDDLRQRLHVALHEGTPNVAQTLVGLGVQPTINEPDELIHIQNLKLLSSNQGHHGNKQQQQYTSSSDESENGLDPKVLFQTRQNNHQDSGYHSSQPHLHGDLGYHSNAVMTSPRRSTIPQVFSATSAPVLGKYSRTLAGFQSKSPPFSQGHQQPPNNNNNFQFYKHLFSNGQTNSLSEKRLQAYRTGQTSLLVTSRLTGSRRRGSVE